MSTPFWLLGARLSAGQQKLLSLVGDLEGVCIKLHQLELRHPLISTTALRQQAYSHYIRAALPEVVKLVTSANLLGRPNPCAPGRDLALSCMLQKKSQDLLFMA